VIAERVRLSPGETEDALRELEAARLAAQSFGGWSVRGKAHAAALSTAQAMMPTRGQIRR
jgi:hypothetical protein